MKLSRHQKSGATLFLLALLAALLFPNFGIPLFDVEGSDARYLLVAGSPPPAAMPGEVHTLRFYWVAYALLMAFIFAGYLLTQGVHEDHRS